VSSPPRPPPQHVPDPADDECIDLHQPPTPAAKTPPPEPQPPDGTFWLRNVHGWLVRFAVQGDAVTIHRTYRGMDVDERSLIRSEARLFWAQLLRQGFERQEGRL
jgi:hypothetical protein